MFLHNDNQCRTTQGRTRWLIAALAIVFTAALAACVPIQPPPTTLDDEAAAATPAPLDELDLANATYQGIYDVPIELTGGVYEGEPFVEGGAARPRVFLGEMHANGDLDGDGDADAAALLGENSGGSGTFIYLAAVLNDNGTPVNAATTILGDRVQVERIEITAGQIELDLIAHGPTDPMCCPSKPISQTWAFTGDALTLTAGMTASDAATDVDNTH